MTSLVFLTAGAFVVESIHVYLWKVKESDGVISYLERISVVCYLKFLLVSFCLVDCDITVIKFLRILN